MNANELTLLLNELLRVALDGEGQVLERAYVSVVERHPGYRVPEAEPSAVRVTLLAPVDGPDPLLVLNVKTPTGERCFGIVVVDLPELSPQ